MDTSSSLTLEDVPALKYTVQVLHEALRLCPPAAVTGRMAMRDIEVDGCRVQAGTMLEATLALATIIRRTEIQSIDADFPMIVPFTTVAADPIRARVSDNSHA